MQPEVYFRINNKTVAKILDELNAEMKPNQTTDFLINQGRILVR